MNFKAGATFGNEEKVVRVKWSFAENGGAIASSDVLVAEDDLIITHFSSVVKKAVTSAGDLTLAVGVTGATSAFMTTTQGAKAELTLGAVIVPLEASGADDLTWDPTLPRKLAKDEKIVQAIGTAVATAGEVEYIIKYVRA